MSHPEKFKQEEEFAKVSFTTNFKFHVDDKFDQLFNNISPELGDDKRIAETSDIGKGTSANKFEEQPCKFNSDKIKQGVDIKMVECPVLRVGCKQGEFDEFARRWSRYAECQWSVPT